MNYVIPLFLVASGVWLSGCSKGPAADDVVGQLRTQIGCTGSAPFKSYYENGVYGTAVRQCGACNADIMLDPMSKAEQGDITVWKATAHADVKFTQCVGSTRRPTVGSPSGESGGVSDGFLKLDGNVVVTPEGGGWKVHFSRTHSEHG